MFFIPYAIIGIPIALVFLARVGFIIEKSLNSVLRPVKRRWGNSFFNFTGTVILVLLSAIFFIAIPGIIFAKVEAWSYRESIYYTVVTLTTVGFGDFIPAQGRAATTGIEITRIVSYKLLSTLWLWLGLAMISSLISQGQRVLEAIETHWWCKHFRPLHRQNETSASGNSVE